MRNIRSILYFLILLGLALVGFKPGKTSPGFFHSSGPLLGAILLGLFFFLLAVNWAQGAGLKAWLQKRRKEKK
ncbi:MAG TPA: hypothetical protein V6C82_01495 [Chroococcales cyanobacterium]